MILNCEQREERYEFTCGANKQYWGKIVFRDCKFQSCVYNGVGQVYTLQDWEFLRDLANEIIRLQADYTAKGNE